MNLAPLAIQKFFDNAGNPMNGGLLYTYIVGTTTKIATYIDSTGVTQNSNPIQLDYRGECRVWLDPTLTYKFTVAPPGDTDPPSKPIWTVDNITSAISFADLTQQIIGLILYPRTAAEIAASVTPTNYAYAPGDVRRYGAVLDGATDDYLAIHSAIAAAGISGGSVLIPGNAGVASSSLGSSGFAVSDNVTVYGLGRDISKITVTGSSSCCVFTATDVNNFRLSGISVIGNNQASGSGIGFAVFGKLTAGVAADKKRFVIEDCHLENFKGDYWIYFENNSATYSFESIYVDRNTFVSQSGNTRDATNIGVPSACFGIFGGPINSANGSAKGVYIRDNSATCNYIKQFADIWNNCVGVWITDNIIRSAGADAAFPNDAGCYAITVYRQGVGSVASKYVNIIGNTIISPKSCGVYSVSPQELLISGNIISGQTDTVDATLPKGAIAINGGVSCLVTDNILTDNYIGISFVADGSAASRMTASGNKISSNGSSARGLRLTVADNNNAGFIEAIDNEIILTGGSTPKGIYVDIPSGYSIELLNISGNIISSLFDGIILAASGTASGINRAVIENNKISGCSNYGMDWRLYTNPLVVRGNEFLGGWGSAAAMLDLSSSTKVAVLGNTFCNMTSGTGIATITAGTTGTMVGNTFINVGAAYRSQLTGSVDMGRDTPTWTGVQGDFVQLLLPIDTTDPGGAAAIVLGWTYTTAWRANYSRY